MGSSRRTAAAPIETRIRSALAALGPIPHFGWVRAELVEYRAADGVAVLRLEGSCPDCDLTAATFRSGIEAHLRRRVPEVREVVATE